MILHWRTGVSVLTRSVKLIVKIQDLFYEKQVFRDMVVSKNLHHLYSCIGKFSIQLFFDRTVMVSIFCRYICFVVIFVLLHFGFLLVN